MKIGVYFVGRNAGDYWANIMGVAKKPEDVEYDLILRDADRLIDGDDAPLLIRDGREYMQITKMNGFSGVAFVENTSDPERDIIKLKLIKK